MALFCLFIFLLLLSESIKVWDISSFLINIKTHFKGFVASELKVAAMRRVLFSAMCFLVIVVYVDFARLVSHPGHLAGGDSDFWTKTLGGGVEGGCLGLNVADKPLNILSGICRGSDMFYLAHRVKPAYWSFRTVQNLMWMVVWGSWH